MAMLRQILERLKLTLNGAKTKVVGAYAGKFDFLGFTSLWTAISRTVWLLGYSPNCETISKTKSRAAQGAQRLIELAEKNCYVLFVGHGFINRYISKELLANGVARPTKTQA
jgi:broad specificity phosphatase PhoE